MKFKESPLIHNQFTIIFTIKLVFLFAKNPSLQWYKRLPNNPGHEIPLID